MRYLILVLLFTTSLVSFGQDSKKIHAMMDSMIAIKQYEPLISLLETERKAYPNVDSVYRWLGYVCIQSGELERAEKYYRQGIEINANCDRCYINLARIGAMQGNYAQSIPLADKAIAISPKKGELYSIRGLLKAEKDKIAAGIDLDKGVELDPKNPEVYFFRAQFQISQGFAWLGMKDLKKVIELSPNDPKPCEIMSIAYFEQSNYEEALKSANEALKKGSENPEMYQMKGRVHFMRGEYQLAKSNYDKALSIDTENAEIYYDRSSASHKLEDMDGACSDLATCLRLYLQQSKQPDSSQIQELKQGMDNFCNPDKAAYYYQRGVAAFNLGDYQRAVGHYDSGLAKFPKDGITWSFKGNALMRLGSYSEAITAYDNALKNWESVIVEMKGNVYYRQKSSDSVLIYENGFYSTTFLSIAECHFSLGQYDKALEAINKGIQNAPNLNEFGRGNYYNLRGTIYMVMGDFEKALADFDQAVQLDPNLAAAYANRAVTRMSLSKKNELVVGPVKKESIATNGGYLSPHLKPEAKAGSVKSDPNLLAAIQDCDKAIYLDETLDYAHYVRGFAKRLLGIPDYCKDLRNAAKLGYVVEEELLRKCE